MSDEQKATLAWLWSIYDVLSPMHRGLQPPPFPRPEPDEPIPVPAGEDEPPA